MFALLLPFELRALTPLLRWAYADAAPGLLFPTVRLVSCLAMVFVPAAALGATFPMAVRWFSHGAVNPARVSSALYAVNTVGAAIGSLLGRLHADPGNRHLRNDAHRHARERPRRGAGVGRDREGS